MAKPLIPAKELKCRLYRDSGDKHGPITWGLSPSYCRADIGIALPGLIGLSGSSPKESRCAKWGEYQCMKKAPPENPERPILC